MFSELKDCAQSNGIAWQIRQGTRGGTDAGRIHLSNGGIITGGISVPCRYIHSPACVASISDFNSAYMLADRFLAEKRFDSVLDNVQNV